MCVIECVCVVRAQGHRGAGVQPYTAARDGVWEAGGGGGVFTGQRDPMGEPAQMEAQTH